MTRYTNVKVRISEGKEGKIKKAFESNCKSITIRLTFSDLHGEDVIAITTSQLYLAYEEKKGMTIKFQKHIGIQHENRRRIFTSVGRIDSIPNRNCFTRIRSWGFIRTGKHGSTKLIGNGMYFKKGSGVCRIETDGEGLYLGPTSAKEFETVGNGFYLMKQGELYDGRGLISSPNSPFKNIPIPGMIF